MQDCFRQHPDIYGAELSDDPEPEDDLEIPATARDATVEDSEALSLGAEPPAAASASTSKPKSTKSAAPASNATNASSSSPHTSRAAKQPEISSTSTATPPPYHADSSSSSIGSTITSTAHKASDTVSSAAHTASSKISQASHAAGEKLSAAGHALQDSEEKIVARVKSATAQVRRDHGQDDDASLREQSESDELVPKAWHDGRDVKVGGK